MKKTMTQILTSLVKKTVTQIVTVTKKPLQGNYVGKILLNPTGYNFVEKIRKLRMCFI